MVNVDEEALILAVQDRPIIYNCRKTNFQDYSKRQKAWVEIEKLLNVPLDTCQLRWKSLRDTYARKLKERNKCPSGSAAWAANNTWPWMSILEFLEPFIKFRNSYTNYRKQKQDSIINDLEKKQNPDDTESLDGDDESDHEETIREEEGSSEGEISFGSKFKINPEVQTCQNKWKNLRDIFVKKKRAKDTNPGMYNLRPWPLMEAMMFVEPYIGNPRGPTDQKKDKEDTIPTQVTTMFQNRKYKLKESNGGVYVLEEQSEDSPEDSQLHIIKLGDVLGNQSQETIDSHDVASAQSPSTYEHPSTSYEIGESTVEIPSDGNGEISMLPKRRRKNETTEDILESAITKLVNESSEPQEDYLDLRTKSLCLLIRSRNLSLDDQVNIMRQCDELVLNYKKSS